MYFVFLLTILVTASFCQGANLNRENVDLEMNKDRGSVDSHLSDNAYCDLCRSYIKAFSNMSEREIYELKCDVVMYLCT